MTDTSSDSLIRDLDGIGRKVTKINFLTYSNDKV